MHPKLSHLNDEQVEQLIQRYYRGEKINELITAFQLKVKPGNLVRTFPPKKCEDEYCCYCIDQNFVVAHQSREYSSFTNVVPRCPVCDHIDEPYCSCRNCRESRSRHRETIYDKKRQLIESCYEAGSTPPDVQDLSFDTAVYLMALTKHSLHEDLKFASPFGQHPVKLFPSAEFTKTILVNLKNAGFINVSALSEVDDFAYDEEISAITGYYVSKVKWEFLPAYTLKEKKDYINQLERMIESRSCPKTGLGNRSNSGI